MTVLTEIYQFLFTASIVFMVYVLGDLIIKTYGSFRLKKDVRFVLTKPEKILLWMSIAVFLSYLIK
jgi:hypothetical protein